MPELAGDRLDLRARNDRQHKLLLLQLSSQLIKDCAQPLRFHGEYDDRTVWSKFIARCRGSERSGLCIALNDLDAVFRLQFLATCQARMAAQYLGRRHQL